MFALASYKICIKNLSHSSKMVEKFTFWIATWPRKVCPIQADAHTHTHAHTNPREEGASIEFKLRIKCEPRERPFILGWRSWVALFQEIDKSKFIIGRARGRPGTVLTFLSSSIEQPKVISTTANRSSTKNKPQLSDEKLLKNLCKLKWKTCRSQEAT